MIYCDVLIKIIPIRQLLCHRLSTFIDATPFLALFHSILGFLPGRRKQPSFIPHPTTILKV